MIVHGAAALTDESNRQAKSVKTSVTNGSPDAKLGGSSPGTPPPPLEMGPVSQTALLPLPSARVVWICKSGRLSIPVGSKETPGGNPLGPRAPSRTMTNCPLGTE